MMKICCVCEKSGASYKCPVCRQPYCSIACCKTHKSGTCEPPVSEKVQSNTKSEEANVVNYEFPTEDMVPLEKLERLRESEDVKQCLKNPHVRDIMRAILTDTNPTKAISLAMVEPIFVELADACLRVVEPEDDKKPC